jgi:hypothetical protein
MCWPKTATQMMKAGLGFVSKSASFQISTSKSAANLPKYDQLFKPSL